MFYLMLSFFSVLPLQLPYGSAIVDRTPFATNKTGHALARSESIRMIKDGSSVILFQVVPGKNHYLSNERIAVFKKEKTLGILALPHDNELSGVSTFNKAQLDKYGHQIYPDAVLSELEFTNELNQHNLYATIEHPFDGAYSGMSRWPMQYANAHWYGANFSMSGIMPYNATLTAIDGKDEWACTQDSEDATDYVSQEAQEGQSEFSEIFVRDGSQALFVGRGNVFSISHHKFAGSLFNYYPTVRFTDLKTIAFEWQNGKIATFGSGIIWSINALGAMGGDDRDTFESPAYPTIWQDGVRSRVSNRQGSIMSINDHNNFVGNSRYGGAFWGELRGEKIETYPFGLLFDKSRKQWHVEKIYGISENDTILALAENVLNHRKSIVILVQN